MVKHRQISKRLIVYRVILGLLVLGFLAISFVVYLKYPEMKANEGDPRYRPAMLAAAMPLIIYIILSYAVYAILNNKLLWKTVAERRVSATLSEKRATWGFSPGRIVTSTFASVSPPQIYNDCALIFKTDEHEHLIFEATRSLYNSLKEGDRGTLTYKSKNDVLMFVSFERYELMY